MEVVWAALVLVSPAMELSQLAPLAQLPQDFLICCQVRVLQLVL